MLVSRDGVIYKKIYVELSSSIAAITQCMDLKNRSENYDILMKIQQILNNQVRGRQRYVNFVAHLLVFVKFMFKKKTEFQVIQVIICTTILFKTMVILNMRQKQHFDAAFQKMYSII